MCYEAAGLARSRTPGRAECAAGQPGRGLGRHLLDCLLRQAGARSIDIVYGDVLAQNKPMLALARSLGFKVKLSLEDASSVRVEIPAANYARDDD